MSQAINAFNAALAASCLALSACGGDSSGETASSANSDNMKASAAAVAPATASISGARIPTATQIVDSGGNVWTVSSGVIYENGKMAGYSNAVTLLVYDNKTLYQENSAGGWWSWSGATWVSSSDPLKATSASGTSIPATTQIVDSSGNIWVVSGGVIYENGLLAGYSNAVTSLVYANNAIYQENSAGSWWSWSGGTWASSSDPLTVTPTTGTASVSWDAPTEDTNGEALTDLAGYTIYYGASASALTKTVKVTNPSATSYVFSNLSAGTYYFAVAAYTTTGTASAQSAVHSKTIP